MQNSLKITEICEKNIPALRAIEAQCFPSLKENFEVVIKSPAYHYYKAELGGEIVAYVGASIICEESDLNFVAVAKDMRRRGIGRKLMEHMLSAAKRLGAKTMNLEVEKSNLAARRLYESLGFEQVYERENYYGKEAAIVMRKTL